MAEEIKKESAEDLQEVKAEAVVVNDETVIVPLSHYEELVAASVELNIVKRMYQNSRTYDYDGVLRMIFGDKPKEKEE